MSSFIETDPALPMDLTEDHFADSIARDGPVLSMDSDPVTAPHTGRNNLYSRNHKSYPFP